ncbi:MAG: hypothetical protein QW682_03475 [Nitrososphaerota archaeon]
MVELDANQIVELFEKNVSARKRLAELIVMEPDIRLAIINAIIRDVATKEDIEKLRMETKTSIENLRAATKEDIEKLRLATKEDINRLDERINGLDKRVTRLEGQMSLFIKLFITFNLPILLGIIGILLKLIFS